MSVPAPGSQHQAALREVSARGTDPAGFEAILFQRRPAALAGEDRTAAAVSLFQFAQRRSANIPLVRVLPHTGFAPGAVVEINTDDMPFLVDSVTVALGEEGFGIARLAHPVVSVRRGADGALLEVSGEHGQGAQESMMQLVLDRPLQPDAARALEETLLRVLADVRAAVEDWPMMRARLAEIAAELAQYGTNLSGEGIQLRQESEAFLRWLDADHFTFLGARDYLIEGQGEERRVAVAPGAGLGIARVDERRVLDGLRDIDRLPPEALAFLDGPEPLIVAKTNARATVHRGAPMDAVLIKRYGFGGQVTGLRLLIGLFTLLAYARPARDIPLLRRKTDAVIAGSGLPPRGHDGKALVHILNTYPRDELFQITTEDLARVAMGILQLEERPRVAAFLRRDPFGRFATVIVTLPKDRVDARLWDRFRGVLLRQLGGARARYHIELPEGPLARVHYTIDLPDPVDLPVDETELSQALAEAARSWEDRLRSALETLADGTRLARRYAAAMPQAYVDRNAPQEAIADLRMLERLRGETGPLARLVGTGEGGRHVLKLYAEATPLPLTQTLPLLDRLGLPVAAELPYRIEPQDGPPLFIHELILSDALGRIETNETLPERLAVAFNAIARALAEDDGLGRLIVRAGLTVAEVAIVRTYVRFLRQARLPFALDVVETTLGQHPEAVRLAIRLFEAKFDPAFGQDRDLAVNGLLVEFQHLLDGVANADDDRILRALIGTVQATVRTNAFQKDADGRQVDVLALKLDSGAVPELPAPRPYREIFVCGPRVEGVHLRGGPIARGGLRWSDRREDFRTEILDLMRAQMVKNAVIVPTGAKGGFVVKRPPAIDDRAAFLAEGQACYKLFIGALLDVTDNLVQGAIVPPPDLVRHDGDDPYLVVAADKGTATFSDLANAIALERGFWMGDAFASGGSKGYDHKTMGITARGAWVSVQRHFREMGVDVQSQPVTVAGVGDMSGDVFGNGMLRSRTLKLIAAFDHRHIFIDPDPDPETAFEERARLFALPRSSWADYDAAKLSAGGQIVPRAAKLIDLSVQARRALGVEQERLTPVELIRAILTAQVDLLYFGGIGTYLKASAESHGDVGDKTNDGNRVDAKALRCKVIGEGANLALTRRSRIEAALHGIRLNTDFIDNSAGVDTSDHEVNLKILFADAVQAGRISLDERDELLAAMTDEVAHLVLRDNEQQTLGISLAHGNSVRELDRHVAVMRRMERERRLNRQLEALPDDETLSRRMRDGLGLTRPELATLTCLSKIALKQAMLDSDLPDDPHLVGELRRYFPKRLAQDFGEEMQRHQLRREIVSTMLVNSLVNRLGPGFVSELSEVTGEPLPRVLAAYRIVREVFGIRDLWSAIEALPPSVPSARQLSLFEDVTALTARAVSWWLSRRGGPLRLAEEIEGFAPGVAQLAETMTTLLPAAALERAKARAAEHQADGVPDDLALRAALMLALGTAPDIVTVAGKHTRTVAEVATLAFAIGERFGLSTLRDAARRSGTTPTERAAFKALTDDLAAVETDLADVVLASEQSFEAWMAARATAVATAERLTSKVRGVGDLPGMLLATRALRRLAG